MPEEDGPCPQDHAYSVQGDEQDVLKIIREKNRLIDLMMDKIRSLEDQLADAKEKLMVNQTALSQAKQETSKWIRKFQMVKAQIVTTKKQMLSRTLCIDSLKVKGNSAALNFYTGFASYSDFLVLYNFLCPDIKYLHFWGSTQKNPEEATRGNNRLLSGSDELLMTLSRLRAGLLIEDLAYR